MRKILLLVFVLFTSLLVQAKESINFSVSIFDEQPIGNGVPKTPVRPPLVYIDDYTLSFAVDHPDYLLIIKDEDSDVVYTTTVLSAQTQVILPSTLSGNYEIQLVMGNWLFTGCIAL